MSDKKLESFKVAQKHQPRVKTAQKAKEAGASAQEAQPTLGFARIEALLDEEDPKVVRKSFLGLVDALEKHAADKKSQKDRAQAKRAKAAVERTMDLVDYLFATKEGMLQSLVQQSEASQKTKGAAKGKGKKGAE